MLLKRLGAETVIKLNGICATATNGRGGAAIWKTNAPSSSEWNYNIIILLNTSIPRGTAAIRGCCGSQQLTTSKARRYLLWREVLCSCACVCASHVYNCNISRLFKFLASVSAAITMCTYMIYIYYIYVEDAVKNRLRVPITHTFIIYAICIMNYRIL